MLRVCVKRTSNNENQDHTTRAAPVGNGRKENAAREVETHERRQSAEPASLTFNLPAPLKKRVEEIGRLYGLPLDAVLAGTLDHEFSLHGDRDLSEEYYADFISYCYRARIKALGSNDCRKQREGGGAVSEQTSLSLNLKKRPRYGSLRDAALGEIIDDALAAVCGTLADGGFDFRRFGVLSRMRARRWLAERAIRAVCAHMMESRSLPAPMVVKFVHPKQPVTSRIEIAEMKMGNIGFFGRN